jgi:hypothetical protein
LANTLRGSADVPVFRAVRGLALAVLCLGIMRSTALALEDVPRSPPAPTPTARAIARLIPALWRRPDSARALERLSDVAELVAAGAPWLDEHALELICRMNLWIFMIDDRFDEAGAAEGEALASLAERCGSVASGHPVGRFEDPVLRELGELRRAAALHPLFAIIGRRWADSVRGVADGMLQEWRWAKLYRAGGGTALPTLSEYMVVAERSIGLLPHVWLTCLHSGDVSWVQSFAHLERMATVANRCVRLANDLRTAAREAREGGINALVILGDGSPEDRLGDGAKPNARSVVEACVAADLEELTRIGSRQVTRSGRVERSIVAITRGLCRFYQSRDFSSQHFQDLPRAATSMRGRR